MSQSNAQRNNQQPSQQQQTQPQPGATDEVRASPTTCIVGCKLPHGLKIELFEMGPDNRTPRVVWAFTLKGNNAARIVGGYGLTDGVPVEQFKVWLERNAQHPAVVNHSVFMHTSVNGAEARAKEGREVRTGIEPINPVAQSTSKRFGIENDKDSIAAYNKQVAENPMRNRQVQE